MLTLNFQNIASIAHLHSVLLILIISTVYYLCSFIVRMNQHSLNANSVFRKRTVLWHLSYTQGMDPLLTFVPIVNLSLWLSFPLQNRSGFKMIIKTVSAAGKGNKYSHVKSSSCYNFVLASYFKPLSIVDYYIPSIFL